MSVMNSLAAGSWLYQVPEASARVPVVPTNGSGHQRSDKGAILASLVGLRRFAFRRRRCEFVLASLVGCAVRYLPHWWACGCCALALLASLVGSAVRYLPHWWACGFSANSYLHHWWAVRCATCIIGGRADSLLASLVGLRMLRDYATCINFFPNP